MRLSEFLQDVGHPVAYFPALARALGGVKAAVLICQLFYWQGKQDDPDGWIFKKQEEIEEETGLTRREQETARRELIKKGVLVEKRRGVPPVMHFKVEMEVLDKLWAKWRKAPNQNGGNRQIEMAESAKLNCRKAPDQFGAKRHFLIKDSETTAESTAETTREHTHTEARAAPGEPVAAQGGSVWVSKSKFSLEERIAYAAAQDVKLGGGWLQKSGAGGFDELIERWRQSRTPEKLQEARAAPVDNRMKFGEAAQIVNSMLQVGRDAQAAIDDLPVSEDVRLLLVEKFVRGPTDGDSTAEAGELETAAMSQSGGG